MSRPSAAQWADAIGAELDGGGLPTLPSMAEHLRQMVAEHGFLTRARLASAVVEFYAPFDLERGRAGERMDEALATLVRLGELDAFMTSGGRGYGVTPARVVRLGEETGVLLGVAGTPRQAPETIARRGRWQALAAELGLPVRELAEELGVPTWREDLVALGGVDGPHAGPGTLLERLSELARDGAPYQREGPDRLRVVGGRSPFFGRRDAPALEGRWVELPDDGTFLGVRRVGFGWRETVVSVHDGQAHLFDEVGRNTWRWAVVAVTTAAGDPLWLQGGGALQLLTPPPSEVERAADLCGERSGAWRWELDAEGRAAVTGVYTRR